MYELFYRQRFKFKNLFTTRFWLRFFTKKASQSDWHHVDHTLPYVADHHFFNKKGMISQAHSPVYRHVFWLDYFKSMGSVDVYARKIIKVVDLEKLEMSEKWLVGKKYDALGAGSSEDPFGIIEKETNDDEIFCSEGEVIWVWGQGWINKPKNTNSRSPQEFDELIIDRKIVKDILIKVWDAKKQMIVAGNNIFEEEHDCKI